MHNERPDLQGLKVPSVAGDDTDVVLVDHDGDGAEGEAGGDHAEAVPEALLNMENLKI